VPATIYYMRDHYRVRPEAAARRRAPVPSASAVRPSLAFMLGILAFVIALVVLGVWLTDGVAAVGRANNQCLTSARRVCGVFPSDHAVRRETQVRAG
jgi:hypothetical protein